MIYLAEVGVFNSAPPNPWMETLALNLIPSFGAWSKSCFLPR